jgi:putative spermidine/putrescine transport system ATP-binding protein
MVMSDRIMVMNQGCIVESGTPVELYRRPSDAFTADFLGQTNLLSLPVVSSGSTCSAILPWGASVAVTEVAPGATLAKVSLRPEELTLQADAHGAGEIVSVSFVGAQVHYSVRVGDLLLRVAASGSSVLLTVGQRVRLEVPSTLRALRGTSTQAEGGA